MRWPTILPVIQMYFWNWKIFSLLNNVSTRLIVYDNKSFVWEKKIQFFAICKLIFFVILQGSVIQPFVLFSCNWPAWFNSSKINRKSCTTKFDTIWKLSRTQVSISLNLIRHTCVHVQWEECHCLMCFTSYLMALNHNTKTKAYMVKITDLLKLFISIKHYFENPSSCLLWNTSALQHFFKMA